MNKLSGVAALFTDLRFKFTRHDWSESCSSVGYEDAAASLGQVGRVISYEDECPFPVISWFFRLLMTCLGSLILVILIVLTLSVLLCQCWFYSPAAPLSSFPFLVVLACYLRSGRFPPFFLSLLLSSWSCYPASQLNYSKHCTIAVTVVVVAITLITIVTIIIWYHVCFMQQNQNQRQQWHFCFHMFSWSSAAELVGPYFLSTSTPNVLAPAAYESF